MSTYNGFVYPKIASHLPTLNLTDQRLISPRIPFMKIHRLRHVNSQYGMYGQIINVPVEVSTMVKQLPRKICRLQFKNHFKFFLREQLVREYHSLSNWLWKCTTCSLTMMVTAMPILHVLQSAKLPWLFMVQLFMQLSKFLFQNFCLCHQKSCNCIDLSSDMSEYWSLMKLPWLVQHFYIKLIVLSK